ncbi:hypothetical protein ACF053_06560 [Streptomyces kanasensis]|uniref:hypothetical protein n=1 Tax=Streptomyces kanasensis TaxID=936756 RepID=UPI0036FEC573
MTAHPEPTSPGPTTTAPTATAPGSPAPVTALPTVTAAGARRAAGLAALALAPAWLCAWLAVAFSEDFGRCLTYGERCTGWPSWVGQAAFVVAGAAWCAVLLVPGRGRWAPPVRLTALAVQLAAEAVLVLSVLSRA